MLRHIESHLDGELSVDVLSGVAAFSKFHFHRQFAALFEIGVHRYIQLLRLKRASYRLAFRDDPLIQIALDSGYEGPEAFCRAFKLRFGQTPSEFRSGPQWPSWHETYRTIAETRTAHMKKEFNLDQVAIVGTKPICIAAMEHRGPPALLNDTVPRFIAWRKKTGLSPKLSATFNLHYDDPATTPPDEYRFDLGAATDREIGPDDDGCVVKTIPGGRCAALRLVGSDDCLGDAMRYLYATWLPQSGEEPRDFPPYCRRVTFCPDVAEHEAITDIYLPLK